jgi:SAM-dependent methyltransferase
MGDNRTGMEQTMKIDQETLAEISGLEIKGNAVTMRKLERSLYLKVDKALAALGGKWTRGAQAHVFNEDPTALIDLAILTGEVTTAKDIGFFPTPIPLARELVELAEVGPGMSCLEPSAGTGRIVDALVEVGGAVVAVERDDRMRQALMTRSLDSVANMGRGGFFTVAAMERDFMRADLGTSEISELLPVVRFDRVVMNPPFMKSGDGDHLDHVRHAFRMLKPGGILVSVLPAGVFFRQDKRHVAFRSWLDVSNHIYDLIPLPEGSFKESGTMINTYRLKVRR